MECKKKKTLRVPWISLDMFYPAICYKFGVSNQMTIMVITQKNKGLASSTQEKMANQMTPSAAMDFKERKKKFPCFFH